MLDEPLGALDRTLAKTSARSCAVSCMRAKYLPFTSPTTRKRLFHSRSPAAAPQGVIIQSGRPHEFFHHPRNEWVARFFGLGNLVEGTVVSHKPLQVETALGLIHASCDRQPPAPGQRVTLLFRPSQVQLTSIEAVNLLAGRVSDQVFQGEKYQVSLTINDRLPEFKILLPNPLTIGERLQVHYSPSNVLCLENGA